MIDSSWVTLEANSVVKSLQLWFSTWRIFFLYIYRKKLQSLYLLLVYTDFEGRLRLERTWFGMVKKEKPISLLTSLMITLQVAQNKHWVGVGVQIVYLAHHCSSFFGVVSKQRHGFWTIKVDAQAQEVWSLDHFAEKGAN